MDQNEDNTSGKAKQRLEDLKQYVKSESFESDSASDKNEELDRILKPKATSNDEGTKQRLESLRQYMNSDPLKFDASEHMPKDGEFPTSQFVKAIDYTKEQEGHFTYATTVIEGFIENYVSNEKLLTSQKLLKVKLRHVEDLAELQFVVKNTQRNLINVQESLDGGDFSIEMYKLTKELTNELRACIDARSKHAQKCEDYWENYAATFGMIGQEEEIIRATEKIDDESKTTIVDTKELNRMIDEQILATNERIKEERKSNKNNEY